MRRLAHVLSWKTLCEHTLVHCENLLSVVTHPLLLVAILQPIGDVWWHIIIIVSGMRHTVVDKIEVV